MNHRPTAKLDSSLPASKPAAAAGFNRNQLRKLQQPLDARRIQIREMEGQQLSYIEGWYAIAQANEIFGHAGWDREMVFLERILESAKSEAISCGYIARVRVRVRAGGIEIAREGTGWGYATSRTPGAAHEKALKSAETDATKRALSTFGSQFGLDLYDKERAGIAKKLNLFAPDSAILAENISPEAFASGLKQLIEKCHKPADIDALIFANTASLAACRECAPHLKNSRGSHYADILLRLAKRSRQRMENEARPQEGDGGLDNPAAAPELAPPAILSPQNAISMEAANSDLPASQSWRIRHAGMRIGPSSISIAFLKPGHSSKAEASEMADQ
jgi:DNA recombination protein Rad52